MDSATNWSYTTGEKGRNRVRVYERSGSGIIYLEFVEEDPETGRRTRRRLSTGHADRGGGEAAGRPAGGQTRRPEGPANAADNPSPAV